MNTSDHEKLIKAGFTIIRAELHNLNGSLRIKYKGDGGHEWKTLEKGFTTKAALLNRMKDLLSNDKIVED